MGKIFKGALLGAVSALGAYYYKNPKELEKHKELLKENTKTGIEKLTAIINEKTQELEAKTQEEQDLAKEKLEELTATAEFEKVEENFVELGAKAEEVKEEVVVEVTEKVEDVKEAAEPVVEEAQEVATPVVEKAQEVAAPAVEKAEEVAAPVVEKAEEVKETLAPAAEPTFTKVEEVAESAKETVVDHYEEKVEPTFEEIHEAVAPVIEKTEEVNEEVEEVVEEVKETVVPAAEPTLTKVEEVVATKPKAEEKTESKSEEKSEPKVELSVVAEATRLDTNVSVDKVEAKPLVDKATLALAAENTVNAGALATDGGRRRNRRAATDHNTEAIATTTTLKDGETADPDMTDPVGATVKSQNVPAGYERKAGDYYTFSILDLTKFNERYNTNYYVRIYKNFSDSTDSVAELIDKTTGAVVETKTITATSGVQEFSTTTTKSNSELTLQVDYQTSMAADKTVQPFLQTGYNCIASKFRSSTYTDRTSTF